MEEMHAARFPEGGGDRTGQGQGPEGTRQEMWSRQRVICASRAGGPSHVLRESGRRWVQVETWRECVEASFVALKGLRLEKPEPGTRRQGPEASRLTRPRLPPPPTLCHLVLITSLHTLLPHCLTTHRAPISKSCLCCPRCPQSSPPQAPQCHQPGPSHCHLPPPSRPCCTPGYWSLQHTQDSPLHV